VPVKVLLATSNAGKLREYRALTPSGSGIELALHPSFHSLPPFQEDAPTFAVNAVGKAIYYSRSASGLVMAEDSGLAVESLGGAPGPRSARYGGPGATDADRVKKLLAELAGHPASERQARFISMVALAREGEAVAIFSDFVDGVLTPEPRGHSGFGYDPIFLFEPLGKTFAELTMEEKNRYSHRARAFGKVAAFLQSRKTGLLL